MSTQSTTVAYEVERLDDVGPTPAADGVGGFEEEEVDAGLGEFLRGAQTREAAADDDDVRLASTAASTPPPTRDIRCRPSCPRRGRGTRSAGTSRAEASRGTLEGGSSAAPRHLRAERPDATALDLAVLRPGRSPRATRGRPQASPRLLTRAQDLMTAVPPPGGPRGRRTRPADGRRRRAGDHGEGRCRCRRRCFRVDTA